MNMILLASKSVDRIYRNNILTSTVEAGPALYLSKQFDELGSRHDTAGSDKAVVNIYVNDGSETGEVVKPDKIHAQNNMNNYAYCVISTISSGALDLRCLDNYGGTVFVDVQGFLRGDKGDVSEKVNKIISLRCTKYLKGNQEELSKFLKLGGNIVSGDKVIIATLGENGVRLRENNTETLFNVKSVVKPSDTIGAGDTFFASFVHYITSQEVTASVAIENAIEDTYKFLVNKV